MFKSNSAGAGHNDSSGAAIESTHMNIIPFPGVNSIRYYDPPDSM